MAAEEIITQNLDVKMITLAVREAVRSGGDSKVEINIFGKIDITNNHPANPVHLEAQSKRLPRYAQTDKKMVISPEISPELEAALEVLLTELPDPKYDNLIYHFLRLACRRCNNASVLAKYLGIEKRTMGLWIEKLGFKFGP